MISWEKACEEPELMITHKDDLKNEAIFKEPWYGVFRKNPHLYREFSDRFDEMDGIDIACALRDDPTLTPDLKNQLHKMDRIDIGWLLGFCPEMSLCMKYKGDPDKFEAAYYVLFPHQLDSLNKEEKREMSKRIMELLGEEKA